MMTKDKRLCNANPILKQMETLIADYFIYEFSYDDNELEEEIAEALHNIEKIPILFSTIYDTKQVEHTIQIYLNLIDYSITREIDGQYRIIDNYTEELFMMQLRDLEVTALIGEYEESEDLDMLLSTKKTIVHIHTK